MEGSHSHKSALPHSALLQGPSSHLPFTGSAPAPTVSLHMAQTPLVPQKGPAMKLTYYLGKLTGWRLPAKYDSTASGELRLQGQASDCLGESRAFCLSSPAGSRQTEPRPSCGKQASFRTVPTHGAEAQGDFQAGWRVIGPAITSFFSVTQIYIEKKIQDKPCISEVSQFICTVKKLSLVRFVKRKKIKTLGGCQGKARLLQAKISTGRERTCTN